MTAPDWNSGVLASDGHSPETLRRAAQLALKHANEWADTAERLLAKANDIKIITEGAG